MIEQNIPLCLDLFLSQYSRLFKRSVSAYPFKFNRHNLEMQECLLPCLWPFKGSRFFHTSCCENCPENTTMSKKGSHAPLTFSTRCFPFSNLQTSVPWSQILAFHMCSYNMYSKNGVGLTCARQAYETSAKI